MSDEQDETKKRGPGRPKAVEPGYAVLTWLPASHYDRLIKLANQRDETVSSLVRQLLKLRLR